MSTPLAAPPAADDLRRAVAGILGVDPDGIPGDANLVYLGLGSLEVMRLATGWRRAGLRVPFADLAADPTIDAWAAHLTAAWESAQDTGGAG
ncbi:phosphopantetheine-binding protein [Krasilnikovia sp. MM14-A1259]|uniref:phosphopantetheine-binding protein n=1 Tax=Krasilnikovia sp. MM14-A1259 TaxID=3373539 RepID=UPI0037F37D7A